MSWGVGRATSPPDVQREVIDLLDSMALTLDGVPVSVGPAYPDDATPEADQLPYLGVMDNGSPVWGAVSEESLIKVTAWARNPSPAKSLAATARGELIASKGSATLGSILPATRSAPVRDNVTGYYMASFTVRVFSRPQ